MNRSPLPVTAEASQLDHRDVRHHHPGDDPSPSRSVHCGHEQPSAHGVSTALPFVSVIVPVFNDVARLNALWDALVEQDYPPGLFECVVVDNSAEPSGLSRSAPFAVNVVHEPRPGSYAARNRGLRAAEGDVFAFTDADCLPQSDWLTSAVSALQTVPGPCVVAGRVEMFARYPDRISAWEWHGLINDLKQSRYVERFHFGATANIVTTRIVFDQVGEFDASLLSSGDYEWGQRLREHDIPVVYRDEVVVRHPARAGWRSSAKKYRRILGGHYVLKTRTGRPFWPIFKDIVRFGMVSMSRTWRDPRPPDIACRAQVILVDLALRCVQLCELVRLSCGAAPRRS